MLHKESANYSYNGFPMHANIDSILIEIYLKE